MEFNSLNSAGIGAELRGNARCVEVVGRNLTFECDVFDGERQIATATLKRTTVERVSFLARTAAQNLIS
jgi:predicted thioesterase